MKNIPTFDVFVNEKYTKYRDYGGSLQGSPEIVKGDLLGTLYHLIPVSYKDAKSKIKSVEDVSVPDKGIKFEVKLTTGDTIHAFKTSTFRGDWEWYFNKKKVSQYDLVRSMESKMFTPFENWKRHYDSFDQSYMYSDDARAYGSGSNHQKFIEDLYNSLSASDKKKADEYKKKS